MSRLIESIRVFNGAFNNVAFHDARMKVACSEVLGMQNPWDVAQVLKDVSVPSSGLFKCRVVYDDMDFAISFTPYKPRQVDSIKIIHDDSIRYDYKYADRTTLEAHFQSKGACDDILIIRNGLVTDTSNANIMFLRGGQWFTPASCLLNGTMRQFLILSGRVREMEIQEKDIPEFESFRLVNAMILDQAPVLSVDRIRS